MLTGYVANTFPIIRRQIMTFFQYVLNSEYKIVFMTCQRYFLKKFNCGKI